jgi:hypothetical protein
MLIKILIPNDGSQTFVWKPQEAFRPAPQTFYQSCILLLKSFPESFRFYQEMAKKI